MCTQTAEMILLVMFKRAFTLNVNYQLILHRFMQQLSLLIFSLVCTIFMQTLVDAGKYIFCTTNIIKKLYFLLFVNILIVVFFGNMHLLTHCLYLFLAVKIKGTQSLNLAWGKPTYQISDLLKDAAPLGGGSGLAVGRCTHICLFNSN